jgi:hypothetical protein
MLSVTNKLFMLNVIMLHVVMLNVIMQSVIILNIPNTLFMLNVIMLHVFMLNLNVFILSVIMLNVVAPHELSTEKMQKYIFLIYFQLTHALDRYNAKSKKRKHF